MLIMMKKQSTTQLAEAPGGLSPWHAGVAQETLFPHIEQFTFTVFRKGKPLRPHRNRGIELHLAIEGSFDFEVEGEALTLNPGEVMVTFPWQEHGAADSMLPPGKLVWIIIDPVCSTPDGQLELGAWCALSRADQEEMGRAFAGKRSSHLGRQDEIRDVLFRLRHEMEHQPPLHASAVNAILTHLLVLVYRAWDGSGTGKKAHVPHEIFEIIDAMKQDPAQQWSIKELCAMAHLTSNPLSRWFTQVTGMTPRVFLVRERLRQSLPLLGASSLSITDIAYRQGFSSSSHFTSSFVKVYGVRPSRYRQVAEALPDVRMSEIISVRELLNHIKTNPGLDWKHDTCYEDFERSDADFNLICRSISKMDVDAYQAELQG
jgi:AraC-like DNA-binding protein/quercetin dioxygenase-like cupin family protein